MFYGQTLIVYLRAVACISGSPRRVPDTTNGDNQGEGKSVRAFFHAVDQVHAEEGGNQRWQHHDDTDTGQGTHRGVHVVVDDARIGVHRRFQNVGIDAGGLSRLCHLDVDVFDEVGIQLVHLQLELQLRQQVFVASDRGDEVGEGVLQAAQSYQALVVHAMVQIALGLLDERVDLFQSLQIPYGRGEEETENHVYIVGESLAALLLDSSRSQSSYWFRNSIR